MLTTPRALAALALAALAATAVQTAVRAAQEPTFKAGTRVVPIVTTVTDPERRLVPGLEQADFTILDNGQPQPITLFESEVTPFTVVVMLDTSASMTGSLDLLNRATEQFLMRMLPADKGQVGAFNDKIQFSGHFTSDRDDLIGALRDLQFGNPTRLWDAVWESMATLESVKGRKVVLVFTDGDDTSSKRSLGDVMRRAVADEIMVYAIGLESEYFNGQRRVRSQPDKGLKKIADETGGGYFQLRKTDDLGPTFSRVAQELHSQYTLGFAPAVLDGKEHKLELRLNKPGFIARARKSYVASKE